MRKIKRGAGSESRIFNPSRQGPIVICPVCKELLPDNWDCCQMCDVEADKDFDVKARKPLSKGGACMGR